MSSEQSNSKVECPVCGNSFTQDRIERHVNECLTAAEITSESIGQKRTRSHNSSDESDSSKRLKADKTVDDAVHSVNLSDESKSAQVKKSPVSSFFTKRQQLTNINIPATSNNEAKSTNVKKSPVSSFFTKRQPSKTLDIPTTSSVVESRTLEQTATNPHTNKTTDSRADSLTSHKPAKDNLQTLLSSGVPLAEKMRPKTLEEYVGQEQAVGQKTMLYSLLENNNIPSMIIWGPPGCGKTTLARIVMERCKQSGGRFAKLSATTAGIADVKEVIKIAKNEQKLSRRRTVLFVDEIHRFNKLQQDSFLPHVEDGTIVLLGATTENPSFQVNNALLSRCKVVVLEKHGAEGIEAILRRALGMLDVLEVDEEQEKQTDSNVRIESAAIARLAFLCDGDARIALNGLETALRASMSKVTGVGVRVVTVEDIKRGLEKSHIQYDRAGEEHYNCASALQKSIRGSNPDGAIYWMTRMLEGGEDPLFIARRLVVCASEDIGLADPQALPLAVATFQACHFIGKAECPINLAHCCTYLARAPKSNESLKAYQAAQQCIRQHQGPLPGVPLHLRNAPTKLMKNLGYGAGYKYSHNYDDETGKQDYLPEELKGITFFNK